MAVVNPISYIAGAFTAMIDAIKVNAGGAIPVTREIIAIADDNDYAGLPTVARVNQTTRGLFTDPTCGGAVPLAGVGADTAFPTPIVAVGTLLGAMPAGARGVEIDIPPGATVAYYIATAQAPNAAAAALVAHSYQNPAGATTPLPVEINLSLGQEVWIINVVGGASSMYTSGLPTFRWL